MDIKYAGLRQSAKTKTYSYRKGIPEKLRYLFDGKRELKVSFKTKDQQEAIRLWHQQERMFEAKVKTHKTIIGKDEATALPFELLQKGELLAKQFGVHPSQRPVLQAGATEEEKETFKFQEQMFFNLQETALEAWITKHTDETGKVVKKEDTRDPNTLALMMAMGKLDVQPEATWQNLLDFYLKRKADDPRNQKKKFINTAKRVFRQIGETLPNQMETLLGDIKRLFVRESVREIWPNPISRKRCMSVVNAAIKTYQVETGERVLDGYFVGLYSPKELEHFTVARRPFSPQELSLFLSNVEANETEEIQLIALIMTQTGARNREVTGLHVNDVKYDHEVPHLIFRKNKIRLMGKGGLERAVPISKTLAKRLASFIKSSEDKEKVFYTWASEGMSNIMSRQLSKHIENLYPEDERKLQPYSLRHTFIDKCDAARIPNSISEYLTGHKTKGSSTVHKNYGTRPPPKTHVEDMERINSVENWGHFE